MRKLKLTLGLLAMSVLVLTTEYSNLQITIDASETVTIGENTDSTVDTSKTNTAGSNKKANTTATTTSSTVTKLSGTKFSDISNTEKGIKLTWKKSDDASGYVLYRNGARIKVIKSVSKLSYTDTQAKTNGTKYKYQISVYKKVAGKTLKSKLSKAKGQYYLCANKFDTVYMNDGSTYVSWTANYKVQGYELEYASDADFTDAATKILKNKSNLKITLKKLSKNKNYYFRVRGYRYSGNGSAKRNCYSPWSSLTEIIAWNNDWEFASNSLLHSDSETLYYSNAKNKKNKVVCVNAGHGTVGGTSVKTLCHPDGTAKVTGGSTAAGEIKAAAVSSGTVLDNGISEADTTLALAKVVKNRLLKAGFNVLMVRETKNANIDNVARTVFANNNADYHIALHYDSSDNDKGAFYIGPPNISSYRNMYPVSKNWKKHINLGEKVIAGMKDAGVKIYSSGSMSLDLTQISYSTIASIDVEVGDRASDTSAATFRKIAEGITRGLK